eukprot:334081-Alexandrium_andersonii.AAC.1
MLLLWIAERSGEQRGACISRREINHDWKGMNSEGSECLPARIGEDGMSSRASGRAGARASMQRCQTTRGAAERLGRGSPLAL